MKKFITLIVAIFMILAIMTSCDKNKEPIETSSEAVESIDTTVEETEKATQDTDKGEETSDPDETEDTVPDEPAKLISVFKNGQSDFTIVYADSSDGHISEAGLELKNAIKKYGSTTVGICKESEFKSINNGSLKGAKIVIDVLADDKVSQDIYAPFEGYFYPYTIKMSGGSLYIIGSSTEATVTAINYFMDTYLSQKISSLELEENMDLNINPEPPISDLKINGNSIYDYTIVYCDSYYAKQAAYSIQDTLTKAVGKVLPVAVDSVDDTPQKYEILVGKTSRSESAAVRAEYDRPNVYYDIVETNEKLVIMAEGYTTLDLIDDKLTEYLGTLDSDANIVGSAVHDNVLKSDNMLERADGTELRVMAWNMAAPSIQNRVDLWEKQADTILMHLPDVFGTNELYSNGYGKGQWNFIMGEVLEYYTSIETSSIDDTYGTPWEPRDKLPHHILVRKDIGLSVSLSGFQLLAPGDGLHGIHWAILERSDGNKFIYSIAHYTSSHNDITCPTQHANLLKQVQKMSGSVSTLPAIISGDLFMNYGNVGYKVLPEAGYKDAQREALVNANNDISHGTFHDWGQHQPGRAEIDLIFYNPGFEALKHKVVVMQPALDSSDHCPVVTDFRF